MKMRASDPFKNMVEIVFLILMAIGGGVVAYWYLDDTLPYDYHRFGASVTPNPAPPGGRVTVTWPVTIRRLCPGVVHRSLRDAATDRPIAQYDPLPAALTVAMGDPTIKRTFLLPAEDLPEIVKYSAVVCFRCNPLHAVFPICTMTPELVFRVSPRAVSPIPSGPPREP